jgi:hypothetical protein
MITDASLTLSASQAVTASAVSANTIDLGQARDIGGGEEAHVFINVEVSAAAAGAATVNFQVVTSANANLSTPTIVGQTDAIPKASLVAGKQITIPVPRSFINALGQRYLGLQYTVGTGPLTAGTFSAYILPSESVGQPAPPNVYPTSYSVR